MISNRHKLRLPTMFDRSLFPFYQPFWWIPVGIPLWWYGRAFVHTFFLSLYLVASAEDRFSLLIMLKQILLLQPLHQDFSIIGRAIGVVVRILWSIVGIFVTMMALMLALILIAIHLLLPVALFYGLWVSFGV